MRLALLEEKNWALPSVIALGKGFPPVFSASCWFLSYFAQKIVFVCFRLSYVVFSIMFLRTGFSLCSYVNCAFDPLSYRKDVLACWQWDRMFRGFCYKKTAISFFVSEYPFLSLIVAKIGFLYVGNKIALLWVLYHKKKSVFAFSLLKHVGLSFIAQKTCFGLFAVILGCFQCYCTKKRSSSSMQGVTLVFTWFYSNNGFAFFWLSYAVSESSFWGQPCSLFP